MASVEVPLEPSVTDVPSPEPETPAPPKPRPAPRGRPAKVTRPEVLELPAKKRGRPVGSSAKKPAGAKKAETSPVELAAVIYGLHVTLATVVPELLLDEREAKSLAAALLTIEKEFPGLVLDPRVLAVLGLVGTAAIIYVPRGRAVVRRLKKKKEPDHASPDPAR